MMPKMSVRPLATRNSSRPYWTLLRIWISHSTAWPGRSCETQEIHSRQKKKRGLRTPLSIPYGRLGSQLAAARRILERLPRDADHLIGVALDASQVDILNRVVRPRHRPHAARAVDLDLLQRVVQSLLVAEAALDRGEPAAEEQRGIVTLDGVYIRLHAVLLAVRVTELLV